MDPYLEYPVLWASVHDRLITYTADTLNALMPSGYVANIGERLYVVEPDREIYPDVAVREHPLARRPNDQGRGKSAVALASDPSWELSIGPDEVRETFIAIVPVLAQGGVVTIIEILSPTNKTAGEGRRLYRTKQREVLSSPTHLLEIDLLRQGEHTVAAPQRERLLRRGPYDYLVTLSRGGQRAICSVWAFTLRQRLPRIRVPLTGNDPDVVLDLQALFDHVYDAGAFARQMDYSRDPIVPLPQSDAEWADALLRERGLRR
jgi:hypothetical protein